METHKAKTSAIGAANHIALTPETAGNINTQATGKIKVRNNAIIAEMKPLLRAVKNPEEKIFSPDAKKDKPHIRMAIVVSSHNV